MILCHVCDTVFKCSFYKLDLRHCGLTVREHIQGIIYELYSKTTNICINFVNEYKKVEILPPIFPVTQIPGF